MSGFKVAPQIWERYRRVVHPRAHELHFYEVWPRVEEMLAKSAESHPELGTRKWRAPWTVSSLALSDHQNWTSYPAYYPHLVRFPHDDGAHHIALRIRNAAGNFTFIGETSPCVETMTVRLEKLWAEAGMATELADEYVGGEDDESVALGRFVYSVLQSESERMTQPQDPSWASPLVPVDLDALDPMVREAISIHCPALNTIHSSRGGRTYRLDVKHHPEEPPSIFHLDSPAEGISSLKLDLLRRSYCHRLYGPQAWCAAERAYDEHRKIRSVNAWQLTTDGSSVVVGPEREAIAGHRSGPAYEVARPAAR